MKYALYIITFFTSSAIFAAASELPEPASSAASAPSCSSEPIPHTTFKSTVLPRFDSVDNHLAYAHRIILSIEQSSRVDEPTKKVFKTIDNAILWFAKQNDQTKIKSGQKKITLAIEQADIKVKFFQHCWFGYRQVMQARKQHGLPETDSYLLFMQHLTNVANEAFKVCSIADEASKIYAAPSPDFTQPAVAKALSKLQAYSNIQVMSPKKAHRSPTKRERKTTQQITAFFKPLKMPRAE